MSRTLLVTLSWIPQPQQQVSGEMVRLFSWSKSWDNHIFLILQVLILQAVWNEIMCYNPSPAFKFCSNIGDAWPNIYPKAPRSVHSSSVKIPAVYFFKDILVKKLRYESLFLRGSF